MKQKLVTFGDSWTWGSDLNPGEKTYGQLIAESKGIEFQNYSQISTAGEHMVLQLQSMIKESDFSEYQYIALFSYTVLSRFMYYVDQPQFDNKFNTNCGYVMYNGTEPGDYASESYYKYIWSKKLESFKFYTTVMTLQNLCQQYNIKDYYAFSFSEVNWDLLNYTGIDRNKFYNQGNTNFLKMFGCERVDPSNKYFLGSASSHPNQLGHQLIADTLADWIK